MPKNLPHRKLRLSRGNSPGADVVAAQAHFRLYRRLFELQPDERGKFERIQTAICRLPSRGLHTSFPQTLLANEIAPLSQGTATHYPHPSSL